MRVTLLAASVRCLAAARTDAARSRTVRNACRVASSEGCRSRDLASRLRRMARQGPAGLHSVVRHDRSYRHRSGGVGGVHSYHLVVVGNGQAALHDRSAEPEISESSAGHAGGRECTGRSADRGDAS